MLEMPADRRQALQVLDRLLPARLAAGAKRWAYQLLKQRRLAIGRGPEHPQVAPGDAELGELCGGPHDLEVGLVVNKRPSGRPGRPIPYLRDTRQGPSQKP